MSKIGIAIKATSAGAGNPISINGGEWTKRVIDIREILMSHIPSMKDDHSQMIIFSSYTEDACIITVARTISGRDWDNVAGWIYIPSNLVISGEEVKDLIDKIKNVISKSELPDEKELNELFAKDYAAKVLSAKYEASRKDGKFAKREIGGYFTLEELLGKDRYQSYYSDYNAIFFTKNINSVIDAVDLSNKDLTSLITFLPPSREEVDYKLGRGVNLKLESGQKFNEAILVNKGQIITLIASREGFESVKIKVQAEEDGQECIIPRGVIWMKKISSSLFIIESETGENLNDKATIEVNTHNITNRSHYFTEQEIENAIIQVYVKGYENFSRKVNLLRSNRINVILEKKTVEYKRSIKLKDGSTGDIVIVGKNVKPHECPLEGYSNERGRLEYRPVTSNVWVQRFYGFLAGIFVWLIFLFIGWWNSVEFSKNNGFPWFVSKESKSTYYQQPYTEQQEESSKATPTVEVENPEQNNFGFEEAIVYLDNNKIWEKSEMEKYPDLQGLFDDLNNMDVYKLHTHWNKISDASENFKKVSIAARKNNNRNWNPKAGPHNPKYNSDPEDYKINIEGYIKWLDNNCTQYSNQGNSSSSSSTSSSTTNNSNQTSGKTLQEQIGN